MTVPANDASRPVVYAPQEPSKFLAHKISNAHTADKEDREKDFRRSLHLAQQRDLISVVERQRTQWEWLRQQNACTTFYLDFTPDRIASFRVLIARPVSSRKNVYQ
jgi:hypothetical protein